MSMMAKAPDSKSSKPTAKDAQRQREDEILKRMLDTPHKAHETKKKETATPRKGKPNKP